MFTKKFFTCSASNEVVHTKVVDAKHLNEAEFSSALLLRQRLDSESYPALQVTPAAELQAIFSKDSTDYSHHERVVAIQKGNANTGNHNTGNPATHAAIHDDAGHETYAATQDELHEKVQALAIGHLQLHYDQNNTRLARLDITSADQDTTLVVLADLLRRARLNGRTSVVASGDYTSTWDAFWTDLGAKLSYTEQESVVDMAAVDSQLMESWIAAQSTDMKIVHWSSDCLDEWIGELVTVANVMNDAPRDSLDTADVIVTESMFRAEVKAFANIGIKYQGLLALDGDGSVMGGTEVLINEYRPDASYQWLTAVLPEYRGRKLGRVMKADMWQHLRNHEPQVTMLHTDNAASNRYNDCDQHRNGLHPYTHAR